jgi:hypothetical protein
MNFSTNQVRQFYVLSAATDVKELPNNKRQIVLNLNAKGEAKTVSEVIDLTKVTHVEYTKGSELALKDKTATVKVTTPEKGKTYTAKVLVYDIFGAGDEVNHPLVAVATYNDDAAKFYESLAKGLELAGKNYNALVFEGSANGITVTTNLKGYNKGWDKATSPLHEVKVEFLLDKDIWTVPEEFTKGDVAFGSGYKLAELEYFCMGERGDQYRMMGYPNHIVTNYSIVPTENYDVIDVMYYYTDNKEGVQRSEKVMTLAVPTSIAEEVLGKFNVTKEKDPEAMDENTIVDDEDFLA